MMAYHSLGDSLAVTTPTIALVFLSTTSASKKNLLFAYFQTLIYRFSPGKTWPVKRTSIDCSLYESLLSKFCTMALATVP